MKTVLRCAAAVLSAFLLSGCAAPEPGASGSESQSAAPPAALGDLAFDTGSAADCRIYLEENGVPVPFLVLTADYGGNCLLLREFLLDEPQPYNNSGQYGAYYGGSLIDSWLETTYEPMLADSVRAAVTESEIEIASKNALDTHAKETDTVRRRIFLLSLYEIGADVGKSAVREGSPLAYFKLQSNRIASESSGAANAWMLRTAALLDGNTIFGVSPDGTAGMGGVLAGTEPGKNHIRPAFCMSAMQPVEQSDTLIDGKTVFCLPQSN